MKMLCFRASGSLCSGQRLITGVIGRNIAGQNASVDIRALLTFWPAWRETRPPSRTERAAGMKSTKQGIVRGEGSLPGNAAVAQVRSPAFPQSSTHLHVSLDRNQAINHNWNLTRSTRV
ncbi:hypothetical protein LSAT2_030207 [Lamellibrachia satsuma]|nr:hypothetical protein LSAT2_030207 [Lamellibrachia satsuma]